MSTDRIGKSIKQNKYGDKNESLDRIWKNER